MYKACTKALLKDCIDYQYVLTVFSDVVLKIAVI